MLPETFEPFTVSGSPSPGKKGGKRASRLWAVSVTFWTQVLMHIAQDGYSNRYSLQTKEGQCNQLFWVPADVVPELGYKRWDRPNPAYNVNQNFSYRTYHGSPHRRAKRRARTDDVKLPLLFDCLIRGTRPFQCYVP